MGSVYRLALNQLTGRWRLVIMVVLASLPVLVAALTLRSSSAPSVEEFESVVFAGMLAASIAPLVVLAIATAAFGNELEDRTLANLTLAPIPRWKIVAPKLAAVITIAGSFIGVSAFLTSDIAFLGDATAVFAVTASAIVGVALYASLFVWLGLVSPQAIGIGLLYIVIWEELFARFVAGARMLSIWHYSIALMHALDGRRFAAEAHAPIAVVVLVPVLLFTGFFLLSVRRLRRMDVP